VTRIPFSLSPMIMTMIWVLIGCAVVLYVAHRALGKNGKTVPRRVVLGLPIAAVLAVILAYSIIIVDVGTVQVVIPYGKAQERRYDPGVHFIVPGARHDAVSVRRQIIELSSLDPDAPPAAGSAATSDAQRTLALSSDRVALAADLTLPYQINPDLAWKVYADIGPDYESSLLVPAARAAVREGIASFTWTDAVATKRAELEERILTVFRTIVQDNLIGAGFTKEQAAKAFILLPPNIRRLAPPRTLLTAVADRMGAEVALERQAVLNQIAERESDRRGSEGKGIRKLIDQLPKAYTPEQLRELLLALADKQRADSLQRAVEKDQVKVIVLGGGGTNATAAVPVPNP
jgi:regulator of protease activity HflC (stomatin/prohibitin superfamily)